MIPRWQKEMSDRLGDETYLDRPKLLGAFPVRVQARKDRSKKFKVTKVYQRWVERIRASLRDVAINHPTLVSDVLRERNHYDGFGRAGVQEYAAVGLMAQASGFAIGDTSDEAVRAAAEFASRLDYPTIRGVKSKIAHNYRGVIGASLRNLDADHYNSLSLKFRQMLEMWFGPGGGEWMIDVVDADAGMGFVSEARTTPRQSLSGPRNFYSLVSIGTLIARMIGECLMPRGHQQIPTFLYPPTVLNMSHDSSLGTMVDSLLSNEDLMGFVARSDNCNLIIVYEVKEQERDVAWSSMILKVRPRERCFRALVLTPSTTTRVYFCQEERLRRAFEDGFRHFDSNLYSNLEAREFLMEPRVGEIGMLETGLWVVHFLHCLYSGRPFTFPTQHELDIQSGIWETERTNMRPLDSGLIPLNRFAEAVLLSPPVSRILKPKRRKRTMESAEMEFDADDPIEEEDDEGPIEEEEDDEGLVVEEEEDDSDADEKLTGRKRRRAEADEEDEDEPATKRHKTS